MAIFEPTYTASTAYTKGARVVYQGVGYRALVDIEATDTTVPFDNPAKWAITHIVSSNNVYGIIPAVQLELAATKNDVTNESLIHLMSLAQDGYERTVRVPQMLDTRYATVKKDTNDNSYIDIPQGCLQPELLHLDDDAVSNSTLSIKRADPTEFRRIQLSQDNDSFGRVDERNNLNFYSPYVYIPEGNRYKITPNIEADKTIAVYGYYSEPKLGRSVGTIDDHGRALDSDGNTLQQWTDAGNSASTFVQEVTDTTSNWFSRSAPDLVIYSTLLQAQAWIKDDAQIEKWAALYQKALQDIETLVDSHEAGTEEFITLSNGDYPS